MQGEVTTSDGETVTGEEELVGLGDGETGDFGREEEAADQDESPGAEATGFIGLEIGEPEALGNHPDSAETDSAGSSTVAAPLVQPDIWGAILRWILAAENRIYTILALCLSLAAIIVPAATQR